MATLLVVLVLGWPGTSTPRAAVDGVPDQVHLSWVGDPSTSIAVTWRTAVSSGGPYQVQWQRADGEYAVEQVEAVHEPAPGGRGYLHKAELTGLEPATAYQYRVSGGGGTWSADLTFRTAPAAMPPEGVVFTVNGDVGTSYIFADVNPVMRQLATEHTGLHLIVGDLTYADQYGGTEYEEYWFSNDLATIAGRRAVMVAWGNHEYVEGDLLYDVDIGTITRYFQLPRNGQANACNPLPYYSFRYADIHFVALDDPADRNTCFSRAAQQAWLQADLARAVADPTVKWKVVFMHRPPFSGGCNGSAVVNRYPELDQYNVDLVLAAHDHDYERTWPVSWDGSRMVADYHAPGLPTYVVAGVAGASTYDCWSPNPWSAFHDGGRYVGYLRVSVTETSLIGELVAKEAYDATAEFGVVDRFTLTR